MMVKKYSKYQDIVTVKNKKLTIQDFETTDPELLEFFEQISPELRQDRLVSTLRIGVIALKGVHTGERIDYIQNEFQKLHQKYDKILDQTLEGMQSMCNGYMGENGEFIQTINEKFGEGSILFKEISDLRQDIGIKQNVDEIKNKTTLKGADFEDHVEVMLHKNAKVFGDIIESTTNTVGKVKRSKKGDFVATIPETRKKITFEIKNVASISANEIQKTLDNAIENREASFGVLIVKSVESVPKSMGWFQVLSGNKLVVALGSDDEETFQDEFLLIAYRWARSIINSKNLKEKQIDPQVIKEKTNSISQKIQKLKTIKTDCNNIEKTSKSIKTTVESLTDEIGEELDCLNKEIEHEV